MKHLTGFIFLILLMMSCSTDSDTTQLNIDRIPKNTEADQGRDPGSNKEKLDLDFQNTDETLKEFNLKVDELLQALDVNRTAISNLDKRLDLYSPILKKSDRSAETSKEPPDVVDVFPEVFRNATKTDIISNNDLFNCKDYSIFEVHEGDQVTIEILFVRNEDESTKSLQLEPVVFFVENDGYAIKESSRGMVFRERTITNPWNKQSNPYVSAVYRSTITLEEAGFYTPIHSKTNPLDIRELYKDTPIPGTYIVFLNSNGKQTIELDHLGFNSGRFLFPEATYHPNVPQKHFVNYKQIRDAFAKAAIDQQSNYNERFPTEADKTNHCYENMLKTHVSKGDIVEGTFVIAWYVTRFQHGSSMKGRN